MFESHTIMDGKVHVYRRENSPHWQCAVFLTGRNHRKTTKQTNLAIAIEFAREWFLDRLAEDRLARKGLLPAPAGVAMIAPEPPAVRAPGEKTFREAATLFVREYTAMTEAPDYVASKDAKLRLYLLPFFGDLPLSAVTAGRIQDYRLHRVTPPTELKAARYQAKGRELIGLPKKWKRPSRSTLHTEIVVLRQVLKTANRKGWIAALPDMSAPYKSSGKVSHRAWFSPAEYTRLFTATRERARNPKVERWRPECERLHEYVLFMVNNRGRDIPQNEALVNAKAPLRRTPYILRPQGALT